MMQFMLQLCFIIALAVFTIQDSPQVEIDQGILRGAYRTTWKGRTFNAFTGIPYAKPPLGDLRFKPPVPAESWTGVLDASQPHEICPQIDIFMSNYNVSGNEDCLYLNVYTPQLPNPDGKLFPVMVFIHGGGFFCGTANSMIYGPDLLLDKDVVLVAMNYRLGALGFLSTEDELLPGNNGLKDQTLALKWVKKNIAQFGGNSDQITIFGQSAGGASVHYHVLSPLSKDLISGAIAHSGVAVAPWALAPKGQALTNAKRLAEFLNCPTSTHEKMVECIAKTDAYTIVEQDVKFMEWHYDPVIPFKPVIEPNIDGAFLTEAPIDIIKSGKAANVSFIIGLTSEDGAIKSAALYGNYSLVEELNSDFNRVTPITLQYDRNADKNEVAEKIRQFYFGDKDIDATTKSELTAMYTDSWFLDSHNAAVELHAKYSKQSVYYYLFSYRGSMSYATLFGDPDYDYGVCHGDDLIYLLNSEFFPKNLYRDSDMEFIEIMTTLWTNYATFGNPTPEINSLIPALWEPTKSDKLRYYLIKDKHDMRMSEGFREDAVKFWRSLPTDYQTAKLTDEL